MVARRAAIEGDDEELRPLAGRFLERAVAAIRDPRMGQGNSIVTGDVEDRRRELHLERHQRPQQLLGRDRSDRDPLLRGDRAQEFLRVLGTTTPLRSFTTYGRTFHSPPADPCQDLPKRLSRNPLQGNENLRVYGS
jgi:hypothetical protein